MHPDAPRGPKNEKNPGGLIHLWGNLAAAKSCLLGPVFFSAPSTLSSKGEVASLAETQLLTSKLMSFVYANTHPPTIRAIDWILQVTEHRGTHFLGAMFDRWSRGAVCGVLPTTMRLTVADSEFSGISRAAAVSVLCTGGQRRPGGAKHVAGKR